MNERTTKEPHPLQPRGMPTPFHRDSRTRKPNICNGMYEQQPEKPHRKCCLPGVIHCCGGRSTLLQNKCFTVCSYSSCRPSPVRAQGKAMMCSDWSFSMHLQAVHGSQGGSEATFMAHCIPSSCLATSGSLMPQLVERWIEVMEDCMYNNVTNDLYVTAMLT